MYKSTYFSRQWRIHKMEILWIFLHRISIKLLKHCHNVDFLNLFDINNVNVITIVGFVPLHPIPQFWLRNCFAIILCIYIIYILCTDKYCLVYSYNFCNCGYSLANRCRYEFFCLSSHKSCMYSKSNAWCLFFHVGGNCVVVSIIVVIKRGTEIIFFKKTVYNSY